MPENKATLFSSFSFLRMQPEFKRLSPNEQMTAKREFEDMLASHQERIFLRTYMTAGLNAESDIMIWRMCRRVSRLQELSSILMKTGMGKWLIPAKEYLGIFSFKTAGPEEQAEKEANEKFGRFPYMSLHAVKKNDKWHFLKEEERNNVCAERQNVLNKYKNVNENVFLSYGLGQQDFIIQREAEAAIDLEAITYDLRQLKNKEYTISDNPYFFCIGRGLAEILDHLA